MAVSRSGSRRLHPVTIALRWPLLGWPLLGWPLLGWPLLGWPLLGWVGTLGFACTPAAPAKHPDHDKVVSAQKEWCDMLAELGGSSWRHQTECEAAFPGASAAYLSRMTACYGERMKSYGDDAPDSGAVIAECTNEVLGGVDPGNVSTTVAGRARCSRQQRCQGVSLETCQGVFDRLDGPSKALLTNVYNLKTQHVLASCLADGECGGEHGGGEDGAEDDESAVEDCYREQRDKLLWLPLSL